ncbi:MAG: AarF/ABC1/UbiB kinase family protein [Alphaproteobacteria bacterium]
MDQNTLGNRLGRYAQTSLSLSGFATKLAGAKLLGNSTESYAESLYLILGNLKGPLMKIGQILSMVPDILPEHYAKELQNLQSNAPPMGELFVRRRMRGELGTKWEQLFKSFNLKPFAAASLGQVHEAESLSGEKLACKLQYPDMESAVEADLGQLKLLLKLYKNYSGALNTDEIFDEITQHLREECDYYHEAKNIQIFRGLFEDCPFVNIPKVVDNLSTKRLLTLSFLQGKKIQEFYEAPQGARNQIAQKLFYAWYMPFYRAGVLHGDPHFGNYSVADTGSINMMDFGCVRIFDKTFIEGVVLLYRSFLENNPKKMQEAYDLWGFQDQRPEVLEVLNLWARYLYGPLLEDRVRLIDSDGLAGKEIAKTVHKRLKELGGVKPPKEFVFMDRAAVGLGSAFIRLKANLNWHELFEDILKEAKSSSAAV